MAYTRTTALKKIRRLNRRIKIIQGGTSAGKTVAILLYLINKAQTQPGLTISVVSHSMPHLKRGALKDFLDIMHHHNLYKEFKYNRTDRTYSFANGSMIEFFSADQPGKVRGPRRDILFVNECNNIGYNIYEQLEIRTKTEIILDFNPVSEFWVHTEVIPHLDHDFLILTYKDNEALDPEIVKAIESRKNKNPNWWRVFGMGLVGVKEGQIFNNWLPIDGVPKEARLERYGLDFGFSVDPTAIVAVYYWNDSYIVDQVKYQKGMSNRQIAEFLKGLPYALTIADSAEPKSIDEIAKYGVKIAGAPKGQGSVNFGIQLLQDQKIFYTKRSVDLHKEQMNYLWKLDKNGDPMNEPEGIFNHAMDAIRYAISELIGFRNLKYNKRRIAW